MKKFNMRTKWSTLLARGLALLSLFFALQARSCDFNWSNKGGASGLGGGGGAGSVVKTTNDPQFAFMVNEKDKDVTAWVDEKGRSYLFAAVKYGQINKVKAILERFTKDNQTGFKHKNEDVINSPDPVTGYTPLGQAIKYDHFDIFKILLAHESTDINRESSKGTPLSIAIQFNRSKMAYCLLNKANIDIKTVDEKSGNTLLHYAIEKGREGIAKRLLDLLIKTEDKSSLSVQNKLGSTPLHLAFNHKLTAIQYSLIQALEKEKDKLWIVNKKGDTPMDVAIQHNQEHGISLLKQLPKERLFKKYDNDRTLLHIMARLNLPGALKMALARITELAGKDKAVAQLFEKTKKGGKTVWAYIILSNLGAQPVWPKTNMQMFKDTIDFAKDTLTAAQKQTILDEIDRLERTDLIGFLTGKIAHDYAKQLRDIVKGAASVAIAA